MTAGLALTQCGPYEPNETEVSGEFADAVLDAVDLLICCADCSDDDDVMDAANGLLEKLEDGLIFQKDGNQTWRAYTLPDVLCGDLEGYTTDPGNGIVLNTQLFTDYSDPVATAVVLAGILGHEWEHCLTLQNSYSLSGGAWTDECDLWHNEVSCHMVELLIIECIMGCGCAAGLTGGGEAAVTNRQSAVFSNLQWYEDMIGVNC